MSRVHFVLPDPVVLASDIQICISHANQGGHLDNARSDIPVEQAPCWPI
jgi:acyl-CoA thioester hydrolase